MKFDQTKTTGGNMAGKAARNQFTANGIMVNTTSLNAQSDLNVRADLTGSVKVNFASDFMPLERFADSAAIQLINSNAKVPEKPAPPAAPAVPAPGTVPAAPALPPPPPIPPMPPPAQRAERAESAAPASGQQGLGEDPWLPV
jgi:hypothetical protein